MSNTNQAATGELPKQMMALRVFEFGGPEQIEYVEVETPTPGPGEVAVRMAGATISGFDLLFRSGVLPQIPGRPPWKLPHQLGREGAGEIAALGDGVAKWSVGDRVVLLPSPNCGLCPMCSRAQSALCLNAPILGHNRFGTQAEYVVVKDNDLLAAPEGVELEILASAIHNFVTVWHGAFTVGGLQPGQDVLITGAGGGLGTSAIVLARHAGARRIIALTGRPEKADGLRELGATDVINWREDEVPDKVRKLTDGVGVDLVLDHVGGRLFELGFQAVRLGGTIVATAASVTRADSSTVDFDLNQLLGKHARILGTRSSTRHEQALVLSLVGSGALKPVISETMPFAQAAEAHRRMEAGELLGKVVLVP